MRSCAQAAQCATGRCAWGRCADADECQANSDCGRAQYCGDPLAGNRTCKTLLAEGKLCTKGTLQAAYQRRRRADLPPGRQVLNWGISAVQRAPGEIREAAGRTALGQACGRGCGQLQGAGADQALVAREAEEVVDGVWLRTTP
jgi:hypothetical protein